MEEDIIKEIEKCRCLEGPGAFCIGDEDLNKLKNLIQKQDTEINKLNNVIDRMAEKIKKDTKWFYSKFDNKSKEEIKEYFMKENK